MLNIIISKTSIPHYEETHNRITYIKKAIRFFDALYNYLLVEVFDFENQYPADLINTTCRIECLFQSD